MRINRKQAREIGDKLLAEAAARDGESHSGVRRFQRLVQRLWTGFVTLLAGLVGFSVASQLGWGVAGYVVCTAVAGLLGAALLPPLVFWHRNSWWWP